MAEVLLEDVCKVYGEGVVAVRDMNLVIPDGEFVVFVGPSGCGKSTALRMIAGLEVITSGRVHIGEQVVNDLPPRDRDIAMVFQNYALYPHMNVRENMGFALKLKKEDKEEINRRVEEAANILGIQSFLDRKPKALSGGQRQRVALGRAIVREPKAFLMDEPLSNLDAKLRVNMRTEISKLHNRLGTTTIYVTHDQTEAMTMADRIVVLKDGEVQQVADPQTMYEHPVNVFVAGFIGSPAMNFLRAHLQRDKESESGYAAVFGEGARETRIPLPERTLSEHPEVGEYADRGVILGVRPEHMEDESVTNGHRSNCSGSSLEVEPEVIESMGSEKYVYFSLGEDQIAHSKTLDAMVSADAGDAGEGNNGSGGSGRSVEEPGGDSSSFAGAAGSFGEMMVARIAAESGARKGGSLRLRMEADKVRLFDPQTERAIG
ncbi:ABC transporter ATP-binding protein [Rubrobacter aplysinae]|uniref:ABC transporter ATP-binding protein n=1 Tax=Rubrobacter aplysinae TaxID=909625 RepID=UPI00064BCA0B|nr:sn-glycerol-3-phosphate ABC transporter ATP-binding protein UgpC [Rubrobacter aplysinae]